MTFTPPHPSGILHRASVPDKFTSGFQFHPEEREEHSFPGEWEQSPHEVFPAAHDPFGSGVSFGKSASSVFWAEAGIAAGLMLCGWGLLLLFCLGPWVLTGIFAAGSLLLAVSANTLRRQPGKP